MEANLFVQEFVMNPWVETIGICLLSAAGIIAGVVFSRFRKNYWMIGYFISFFLIAVLLVTRFFDQLSFIAPFSWLVAGRIKFAILALAVTIGLTTPISRLPRKLEKFTVCFLMVVSLCCFSILPFLMPALMQDRLSNLKTRIGLNGMCYQTTNYTCGPAAAVTALRELGLPADEGQIAVLARTSPIAGTMPYCLYSALKNRYSQDGLQCQYRSFDSVEQLRGAGLTLAVVKDEFLSDHCVAVLKVSETMVKMADPTLGLISVTHEQFKKMWRFRGITLKRNPS